MSRRPYVRFEEVKEKVGIPDALVALGIADQFHQKGNSIAGVCPLREHKHGPSPNTSQFKASLEGNRWVWYCFGDCQRGGSVIDLVMGVLGIEKAHARLWFAEHFGDRLNLNRPAAEKAASAADREAESVSVETPAASECATAGFAPLQPLRFRLNLDPDVAYLRDRGIERRTVERYKIGLCRKGLLAGYIAVPIYRYPRAGGENPVAYLGRWPGEDFDEEGGRPRYKWPEGFAKSSVIYGLEQALETPESEPLIVVEGVFSVFVLDQLGCKSGVSVFGSSVSDEQIRLLIATRRQIAILFDNDLAGKRGAEAAAEILVRAAYTRVVNLADNQQLEDLDREQLLQLLD